MTPPQAHMHWHSFVRHGFPWITLEAFCPGIQDAVTGTQGAGENTPSFAAVAAATAGLVIVVHITNGGMFVIGTASIIVATGFPSIRYFCWLVTTSVEGAVPKVQNSEAVEVT